MKASKEHKPQQSRVFQSGYNRHPIQCVRTIVIEALSMRPTHLFRDANKVNLRRYYKELNLKNDYDNYIQNGIISWQLLNVPPPPNVVTFNNHGNQILRDESLILVSHGARYIPIFGYNFPSGLAKKLYNAHILPLGYRGEIYLDGCHTGEPGPFGHLGDGTSYAERFKRELIKLSTRGMFPIFGHFTVKGNLGATWTSPQGREYNDLDTRSIKFINQNIIRRNININPMNIYMPFARIGNFDLNSNPPQMAGKYGKVIY